MARPSASRWTSFVADADEERPAHPSARRATRLTGCASSNRDTLLVHLSDEDGSGWTVLAVDRATRRWAVSRP
jgi:hypothetical protein